LKKNYLSLTKAEQFPATSTDGATPTLVKGCVSPADHLSAGTQPEGRVMPSTSNNARLSQSAGELGFLEKITDIAL